jgi:hypothetical protein
MKGMMNNDRTFEREEGRLLAAALKARAFRQPLPKGMGERLRARVRAAEGGGRRWWKVAASVAAVASFAAFAATVAVKFAGDGETGGAEWPGVAQSAADETFEEIFSEELAELKKQEEKQAMNTRAVKGLAASALVAATAFTVPSAQGAVRSSVFDDVKVWYKGSAGNAVGTADSNTTTKMKNLPNLADTSSSMHGGDYFWWGWRLKYQNQKVDCPYAGVTLDSTPCLVVPSYAEKTGDATVTINGETTTQPYWTARRFGNLYLKKWMSDWQSGTVCSNWTCVLRVRSDTVNAVSGNPNTVITIGSLYDSTAGKATGASLCLNTPVALADYACPRTFVGETQRNYTDIKIKSGRWVDCALAVNGQTLALWFCWNDGTDAAPTNKLAKVSETYQTTGGLPTIAAGCKVSLASSSQDCWAATFTNGVYNADMANKAFEGAFHQIAFWDRTLSDDEIREAMAGGTGRPNLVQVGIEGNGVAEFATSSQTASVANTGAWEYLNPALTSENPSATIAFDCPNLWAGQSQWLRIVGASAGAVSVALNNEMLGTVNIPASGAALLFVPADKVVSGANTLVLTRIGGMPVIDAVRLGGSWRFGNTISSFSDSRDQYEPWVKNSPDRFIFNPACGSDKLHDRTLNSSDPYTQFRFFVPENMVEKFCGEFSTHTQNTGGSTFSYDFSCNGESLGVFALKGGLTTTVKVPATMIASGWNTLTWKPVSGWANIDWHKFTVLPPPKGMMIIIK